MTDCIPALPAPINGAASSASPKEGAMPQQSRPRV